MEQLTLFTDGSFYPEHRCGGFAVVPVTSDGSPDVARAITGARTSNDIQDMELAAVIAAIQSVPKDQPATIVTDHKTIVDVISKPTRAKVERGRNSNSWNTLRQLYQSRNISLQWVKAHAGNQANAAADRMARAAARSLVRTMTLG